jgi:hypothetical protein
MAAADVWKIQSIIRCSSKCAPQSIHRPRSYALSVRLLVAGPRNHFERYTSPRAALPGAAFLLCAPPFASATMVAISPTSSISTPTTIALYRNEAQTRLAAYAQAVLDEAEPEFKQAGAEAEIVQEVKRQQSFWRNLWCNVVGSVLFAFALSRAPCTSCKQSRAARPRPKSVWVLSRRSG